MSPSTGAGLLALWLLAAGLAAVYFEVESYCCGQRVRALLEKEARLVEEVRTEELRYNRAVGPDDLEKALPEEFRSWRYPLPTPEEEAERARREKAARSAAGSPSEVAVAGEARRSGG